jgi:hypothetical protein
MVKGVMKGSTYGRQRRLSNVPNVVALVDRLEPGGEVLMMKRE